MRNRGWAGDLPATDTEAIDRILDAADAIMAEGASTVRIAEVARVLGVTRPTVYRYFPSSETLLLACAMRSANGFLDQLAGHIRGLTDPVSAITEGIAFAAESLAGNRQIENLLRGPADGHGAVSLTSETPRAFGRSMLNRLDVDWAAHGFDDTALDQLAEVGLRIVHSLLVDPGEPGRTGLALRRFVSYWIGPVIVYPRIAQAVAALDVPVAQR